MNRLAKGLCLSVLAVLLIPSCSGDDDPVRPTTGSLLVRFAVPPSASRIAASLPQPDSVRITLFDPSQATLAEMRAALPDSGEVSVSLTAEAGDDRRVVLQADGTGRDAVRGAIWASARDSLSITAGGETEVVLDLAPAAPERPSVEVAPGAACFSVRWAPVQLAAAYRLYVTREGVPADTLDTIEPAYTFCPGRERGTARLRPAWKTRSKGSARGSTEVRCYAVRAELPLGPGILGDSTCVDLASYYDLPHVVEVSPGDSATGVLNTAPIVIRFDRPMNIASLLDSLVTIRPLVGGEPVPTIRHALEGGALLELDPVSTFERGEWYRIRVSTGVLDTDGRPLDQDPDREGLQAFVSFFLTETYDPVRVSAWSPASNALDVPVTTRVRISFSRAVRNATVLTGGFSLLDPNGAAVESRIDSLDIAGIGFELIPRRELAYEQVYRIRVTPDVLDRERGEPLDQDPAAPGLQPFESGFHTEDQPRGPRVLWTHPSGQSDQVALYDSVVVAFDRACDPATVVPLTTVGVQEYRGGLWPNIALSPPIHTPDLLQYTFVPGRDLKPDTEYRVIVQGGPDGVRDMDGIPLDQDPITPGFQADTVSFRTELPVMVEGVYPCDLIDVAWDDTVRVTFNGAILPVSVSESSLTLTKEPGGTPIAGTRWVSADNRKAFLKPLQDLGGVTSYKVVVGTGILSSKGGRLDQSAELPGHQGKECLFTTACETNAPRVVEMHPADNAPEIPISTTVEVVFDEPVRPELVRTYFRVREGSLDGPYVAGPEPVPSPDRLSATFTPAAPLKYVTAYHVLVSHLVTDFCGNGLDQDSTLAGRQDFHGVFTTQPERIAPQVVGIVPVPGASGVLAGATVEITFSESMDRPSLAAGVKVTRDGISVSGSLGFADSDRRAIWTPTSALQYGDLYRVRVDSLATDLPGNGVDQVPATARRDPFDSEFTTEPDTYGPRIVQVYPADDTTGVEITVMPKLRFDEPVDTDSLEAVSLARADSAGAQIAVYRSLDAGSTTLTLAPQGPLEFETDYRITVLPGLTDRLGNRFDADPSQVGNQPFRSTFRTRVENIPPRVTTLAFAEGPPVPVDSDIRIIMSEPIDVGSVTTESVRLLRDEAEVPGVRTVSASKDTLTINPTDSLLFETAYRILVSGVLDQNGNRLDQDAAIAGEQPFDSTFTTEGQYVAPPRVASMSPGDGSLGVGTGDTLRVVFSQPMDTTSFTGGGLYLARNGYQVAAQRTSLPGLREYLFRPIGSWQRGRYQFFAQSSLRSVYGDNLDQDQDTPGFQNFLSTFEVGHRPIPSANGVCPSTDATLTQFAGSAVPGDGVAVVSVIWNWGDNTSSSYAWSAGQSPSHVYPCVDGNGCDGIDNDGDHLIDEGGAAGCDESYQVVMTVEDSDGLRAPAESGVSFCAFRVRTSLPAAGATGVALDDSVHLALSRACNPGTVTPSSVRLALDDLLDVPVTQIVSAGLDTLTLIPTSPLMPDATYTIHVHSILQSAAGDSLDQLPCTPGRNEFEAVFRTVTVPGKPRGL